MKNNEEAIKLLREALIFINFTPNKPYRGGEYLQSYTLASEITQFFDKLKGKDDTRKK